MSYRIDVSIDARHTLARLPAPVRKFAAEQLQKLAENPTAVSRPSYFPYRAKCQLFQFNAEFEGKIWELAAMFQFSQDEQVIHILAIGFSSRDPG